MNTSTPYLNQENLKITKSIIDIIQGLVIILATIFTARWTYKTFAHKEKLNELKELKNIVIIYFQKIQLFCAQVRENATPDDRELKEKIELGQIHNELLRRKELNLYTRPKTREKIQKIVGRWITDRDRIKAMQSRKTDEERTKAWQEFEEEYKEVKDLIDKEANKLI